MELRYLFKSIFLPPFTQILLLLFAWKIRHKAKRTSSTLFCVAIFSLWLLSSPVVATFLARTVEQEPALSIGELGDIQADAIVILSAAQNDSAPEFGEPVSGSEQLTRIRYGAFLQRKTNLPVLLSGGSVSGLEKRSNAETMAYDLETGYGGKAGWLEEKSRTTAENAQLSHKVLAAENKTSVILVTSAMHMMRAKWSFEQAGFTVIPAPTYFTGKEPLRPTSFLPNTHALDLSSRVIHEWLGCWVYKLFPL